MLNSLLANRRLSDLPIETLDEPTTDGKCECDHTLNGRGATNGDADADAGSSELRWHGARPTPMSGSGSVFGLGDGGASYLRARQS